MCILSKLLKNWATFVRSCQKIFCKSIPNIWPLYGLLRKLLLLWKMSVVTWVPGVTCNDHLLSKAGDKLFKSLPDTVPCKPGYMCETCNFVAGTAVHLRNHLVRFCSSLFVPEKIFMQNYSIYESYPKTLLNV